MLLLGAVLCRCDRDGACSTVCKRGSVEVDLWLQNAINTQVLTQQARAHAHAPACSRCLHTIKLCEASSLCAMKMEGAMAAFSHNCSYMQLYE